MATKVFGNINVGLLLGLRPVRLDVRHHDHLRPLGRPRVRPDRRARCATRSKERAHDRHRPVQAVLPAATQVGSPASTSPSSRSFVVVTLGIVIRAAAQQQHGGRLLRRRPRLHRPAERHRHLAATTCRPRRSSASPAPSRINGYDGFLYSIGFLVAWLVALLLVAELLRNTGRFTMADVLSFRLRQRPVRMAAAISTARRLLLLPAGADGRRRRPGRPAARRRRPSRPERGHRRRRRRS